MYAVYVEGMNCNHCISKVTRTVKQLDAAAIVDINLATKTVLVDTTADVDEVCDAITDAGYLATAAQH